MTFLLINKDQCIKQQGGLKRGGPHKCQIENYNIKSTRHLLQLGAHLALIQLQVEMLWMYKKLFFVSSSEALRFTFHYFMFNSELLLLSPPYAVK